MNRKLIGLATDDLRLPVKAGLQHACDLGFGAVEIGAAGAEINPRELSGSGRRHLGRYVANLGLSLAAFGADNAESGRLDARNIDPRAEQARAVLEMAAEVGTRVVTVRLGSLTDPATGGPAGPARQMLAYLADQADRVGSTLAIRSGADDPARLVAVLGELGCPALRVCLDPAALLMAGHDPALAVGLLADHLVLSHARDAVLEAVGQARETALGRGEVDFSKYLAALIEAGYTGPHIVRRTDAVNPLADSAASRQFLASLA